MKNAQRRGVGIDLGTTHCALAHLPLVDCADPDAEQPEPETQELLQVIEPGEVSPRPLLPSFLYLAGEHELPTGALDLPWSPERSFAVGEFARDHGAKLPGRLVSSAKSWLCQTGVDRREAILPWKGAEGVQCLSPVTASARYIEHLSAAWRNERGSGLPDERVVLAVPASFDAAARDLTVEAEFDASAIRLVGDVQGDPPFSGSLTHHGWRAETIALPELPESMDPMIVAPAEVEV
jgi:molecular chaperone DnaK (HSP70)